MGEGSGTGLMSMSVGGGGWDAEMSVASLGVNCVSEASLGENCVSEASLGGVEMVPTWGIISWSEASLVEFKFARV